MAASVARPPLPASVAAASLTAPRSRTGAAAEDSPVCGSESSWPTTIVFGSGPTSASFSP